MEAWYALPALALLAGAAALVPLGHQVLRRGVVFIDLAVAQAAAAGSLWALVLLHQSPSGSSRLLDLASLAGSLLCAGAVAGLSRRWPERREALIGLLYVLSASAALLGARLDPHGRDRLLELLAADVLWAQAPQVGLLGLAAAGLWAALLVRPHLLGRDLAFYVVFAVMVSLAVPVLGLFVVFALLIGPALWWGLLRATTPSTGERSQAANSADIRLLLPALGLAVLAGLAGLAASAWWDAPSGPCVAAACALMGLASLARRRPS